ncbi:ABC transporter ATP-binding protein [Abiotrophia defectiva]|uniref:ABC transporter, ATP-binding protein n=1 Tax=Abiotrophia defectiva ATCC 49176 TaxID=592010 RepID=W1Q4U1_ABIDE|nr:ABC transporter ATP-binding protein [Abiotrophia defectiva]ESK64909.1 ABC transporter, ATP-binding protein [Abiotrophia defectiva ATCC 49176]QKH47101.1 ABC transporter ATP-binding protein [Abiotrophia defectiva]
MENKKRRGDWSSIIRLLKFMWQDYKWVLLVSAVLIVISALVTVNLTSSIRSLVDNFVQPMLQTGSSDFGPLRDFLLGLALFCLVGVMANYGFSIMMATISQDALRSLRNQLFERMQKLPVKYFDTHPHGDIMSIYTNDIDALRQAIEQSIPQLFSSAITMIGVTVSMLVVSPLLFLVVAVMLAIMVWVIKTVSSKSGRYFGEQQKNLGIENGFIEEMMAGQKVIKAFVHEAASIESFDQINEQLFQSSYLANRFSNVLMPILGNLGNVSFVLTSIAGGFMALNGVGGLTIGGLMSFLQLNRSFIGPIAQVSQQLNFVLMASAGADRIFNLLDEEPEVNQGKVSLVNAEEVDGKLVVTDQKTKRWAWKHPRPQGQYELVPLVGKVVFNNVDFSYDGKKQILHDIKLYADKGQKVAFVGATGAGKTTITNLINRFYDIQSGSITYDGIDVKLIDKDSLRKSLGIVLQDTHLFTGTIAENIAYGREDASREEILEAARIANVDSFVKHLDQGYETMLTDDGAGLSNGQRQLIAIARAALADAPVLILDEATSSIDSRTEKMVQEGLDRLMAGRTVFVIAHRLSTIVNSDVIMVMDHGRIIERGNHASLMAERGTYYRLYTGGLEID